MYFVIAIHQYNSEEGGGGVRGTSVSGSPAGSRPSQSPVGAVNVAMAIEHLVPLPTSSHLRIGHLRRLVGG